MIISCRKKDPHDSRLQGEWSSTQTDSISGIQSEANLFFLFDGNLSYDKSFVSWSGEWSTDNGTLILSFENGSINGTYNYEINKKGGVNSVSYAFSELELSPIELDDSLSNNPIHGTYMKLN